MGKDSLWNAICEIDGTSSVNSECEQMAAVKNIGSRSKEQSEKMHERIHSEINDGVFLAYSLAARKSVNPVIKVEERVSYG